MTHVTCRLTGKNRDQLRNPTLGNRVWSTFTFFTLVYIDQLRPAARTLRTTHTNRLNRENNRDTRNVPLPVFPGRPCFTCRRRRYRRTALICACRLCVCLSVRPSVCLGVYILNNTCVNVPEPGSQNSEVRVIINRGPKTNRHRIPRCTVVRLNN